VYLSPVKIGLAHGNVAQCGRLRDGACGAQPRSLGGAPPLDVPDSSSSFDAA
jgi:hypothetical protein